MKLSEKLDALSSVVQHFDLLQFKLKADRQHDKDLIDWFADGGELRAYRHYKITGLPWRYNAVLFKNGLSLTIGALGEDFDQVGELAMWRMEYLSRFLQKNTTVSYCVSDQLKTIDEIRNGPGIISSTEDTITYSDGSFSKGNIFKFSKDTVTSFKKSEADVIKILAEVRSKVKSL